MANILLLEDDATFSKIITSFLGKNNYKVTLAQSVKEAYTVFLEAQTGGIAFDVLLLDYHLPDGTALDFIEALKNKGVNSEAFPTSIIMTSFNDVKTAVKALKTGVIDYITKPVHPDVLLQTLKEGLAKRSEETANKRSNKSDKTAQSNPLFIQGNSEVAQQMYKYVQLVAPTEMSVLIQGESGTGKEHIARLIHDLSPRKGKPFVAVDCGALSKDLAASEFFGHKKGAFTGALQDKVGQFESANGGTLFLDEIGNLSYDIQIKLLRVIQERVVMPVGGTSPIKVDIRIIAASNYDLLQGAKSGDFREDLYHRLNEFKIYMPALRERKSDLNVFIHYFMERTNKELGKEVKYLSPELLEILIKHEWPGNLRELSNVIKRVILLTDGDMAGPQALPEEMIYSLTEKATKSDMANLKTIQEEHEREMIINVLQQVRFNKSKAAKLLQIDRKTLYSKIEKYNIH